MKKYTFSRKTVLILASLAALAMLAGCNAGLGVDNYMRPPAPSGDSAAIQQLLVEQLGSEYTLRYPRSGEYRSAVVLADVDSDSQTEGIVFYRLSTESTGANMLVIDRDGDEWVVAGQTNGSGEIDRVLLGDVNGDGADEIITGWSGALDSATIRVHSLIGGVLHEIKVVTGEQENYPADQYYEMAIGDFDGDLRDEIMTIYRSPSEGVAVARILRLGFDSHGAAQLSTYGTMNTDGSVQDYLNAQSGYTALGCYCMVTDGRRASGEYVTELICWDKETASLTVPFAEGLNSSIDDFRRTLATLSQDVNGDGMIDIPVDRILPGYSAESANPMYLTSWYNVSRDDVWLAVQAVMRFDQGYYFSFPAEWGEKVTVQPDVNSAMMYFYSTDGAESFSDELFRIRIFTLDEWADRRDVLADALLSDEEAPEWQRLAVTDYYVYAVLISPAAEELGIDEATILQNFHLYS